jgi:hypothetical protein
MYDPLLYANIWKFIARSLSGIMPTYSGRVYYQVAPVNSVFPVLVYQPVVNQSYANLMLNDSYWEGLITFRSMANTFSEAQDRLAEVITEISTTKTITVSGVHVPHSVRYCVYEVPSFPVERLTDGYIYTAAVTMETYIFPTDY